VIAVVDTNSDPDEADYIIPGNDDAIRSCDLIVRVVADGIATGQQKATPADFTPPPAPEPEPTPEGEQEQASESEQPAAEEVTTNG
jgi:small subunit ribosomal protein S2